MAGWAHTRMVGGVEVGVGVARWDDGSVSGWATLCWGLEEARGEEASRGEIG